MGQDNGKTQDQHEKTIGQRIETLSSGKKIKPPTEEGQQETVRLCIMFLMIALFVSGMMFVAGAAMYKLMQYYGKM